MTTVLDIQRQLKKLGFDPGAVDGALGPKTLKAMSDSLDALEALQRPPMGEGSDNKPDRSLSPVWDQPKARRPIGEVIIHCTATREGQDISVEAIRGWHKARGWSDIGYHWVVMLDGTVEPGREEALVGAHVAGHNAGTLGVVYVGGVASDGKTPKDTRTPAQKAALMQTTSSLIQKYPKITKVTGHNQYAAKACPSFDVRKDPLGKLAG